MSVPPSSRRQGHVPSGPNTAALQAAVQALQTRRFSEASRLLSPVVAFHSRSADARFLFAAALRGLGDLAGAERELRAAIVIDNRHPHFHAELGGVLRDLGRVGEAEGALRAAMALDRRFTPAILPLSEILRASGRAAEAVRLTTALITAREVGEDVLSAHAEALKMAGLLEQALAINRRAVSAFPRSAHADHNLAATLGDLGMNSEAEAAARKALAKGLDHTATWLVLGRALQAQQLFDQAEDAFRRAISRAPAYAAAYADLSQLVWMRTGDKGAACSSLISAVRGFPHELALKLALAQLLEFTGDPSGARAVLEGAAGRQAPVEVNVAAARANLNSDPQRALAYAEFAVARGPNDLADLAYCEALLACGRPMDALGVIDDLRRRRPFDQHVLAYQATAWRLTDDARYGELYDYDTFVRGTLLETPKGWTSLPAYLADLAAALVELHTLKHHPVGQSLRFGTQTNTKLERSENAAISAFFQAFNAPVRQYLGSVGRGADPFRSRNQGRYVLSGSWSVLLQPGAGVHVNHAHQQGWLSSVCYIDLPSSVSSDGRQGWLKFGEPGTPTAPVLTPDHYLKPEPGMLAFFPSYMWHGTTPFDGDQRRLTLAFDLIPH